MKEKEWLFLLSRLVDEARSFNANFKRSNELREAEIKLNAKQQFSQLDLDLDTDML